MKALWHPFEASYSGLTGPLIDTHCHYDDERFDPDRDTLWQEARKAGVVDALICSVHPDRFERTQSVARRLGCHYGLGIHPYFLDTESALNGQIRRLESAIENALDDPLFVAIGEIGLDGTLVDTPLDAQLPWFEAQLSLACRYGLPVSLHAHRAIDAVIAALRRHRPITGIVHAFNGSLEQAKQLVDLELKLGFGGVLTNPGAKRIRRVFEALPETTIVLETDAPDMPGQPRKMSDDTRTHPCDIAHYRISALDHKTRTLSTD